MNAINRCYGCLLIIILNLKTRDSKAVLCIGDFVALYYRETQGFVFSSQSRCVQSLEYFCRFCYDKSVMANANLRYSSAYNRLAVGINHDVKNPEIGDPNSE